MKAQKPIVKIGTKMTSDSNPVIVTAIKHDFVEVDLGNGEIVPISFKGIEQAIDNIN